MKFSIEFYKTHPRQSPPEFVEIFSSEGAYTDENIYQAICPFFNVYGTQVIPYDSETQRIKITNCTGFPVIVLKKVDD